MITFRCFAVLFDLDGVLIDSIRSVDRQWRIWAHEHGVDADKVVAAGHGVRAIEVIRTFAPHVDAEREVRILENREADDREGVAVMPGAVDLVRSIPEGRWCIVTSGTRHLAEGRVQFAGIPVPKILVTADDVVNGKPNPEPYLKGAELLGANPVECLVIEDAPAGIRSARAGGMKSIRLMGTHSAPDLSGADAVIRRLEQLHVTLKAGMLTVNLK